ncbi:MAG: cytochrome b [Alphaproteobacteria bacterium]|nr:cytochrome b [Alphaproteobacteria bacterium]
MNWRNTAERYGAVAIGFHWIVAVLVITLLAVGLVMTDMKPGPDMFKIYATHKSIGIMVLGLVVLRLLWKLTNPRPASLPTHRTWERLLAKAVHLFLYFAIIAMPLSGWIMSSAKGFPVSVFGWFTLPDLVAPDKDLSKAANEFHELIAYTLIVAIVLHFSGALKHHLIDKDGTLRRMLPCPCRGKGDRE